MLSKETAKNERIFPAPDSRSNRRVQFTVEKCQKMAETCKDFISTLAWDLSIRREWSETLTSVNARVESTWLCAA